MHIRRKIAWAVLSLAVVAVARTAIAEDSSSSGRVLSDLRVALSRLERAYTNVQGTCSYSEFVKSLAKDSSGQARIDKKSEYKYKGKVEIDFALKDDYKKMIMHKSMIRPETAPAERVYCIVSDRLFSLERHEPGGKYSVRYVGAKPENDHTFDIRVSRFLSAPFAVSGVPFTRMMNDPSFAVRSISRVRHLDRDCWKIDYTFQPSENFSPKTSLRSGWIIVSPADGWAIQEVRCDAESGKLKQRFPGYMHIISSYDGSINNIPILKKVVENRQDALESVYDFRNLKFGSIDDREFTLSFYGLPEIEKPSQRSYASHAGYWFFGLAVTALSTALALKYYAKRLQRE